MIADLKKSNKLFRLAVSAICLLLLINMIPVPARAAGNGSCGENLQWSLNAGTLTVSGTGKMTNFSDNNLAPWYDKRQSITSVIIESGVTSVGELAFHDCGSLSSVTLPDTVLEIGIRSFKDCVLLTKINFPPSLYVIAESAFEHCVSLNNVRFAEGLVVISSKAFYRCSSLTNITIPESVNFFGMVTFAYCENLVRADIRCPIERIPDWTFYGCTSLVTVSIPETVTVIGDSAFYDCKQLTNVHYSGENEQSIFEQINPDTHLASHGGINTSPIEETAQSVVFNKDYTSVVYTDVTETENSIITVTEKGEYINDVMNVTGFNITASTENDEGLEEVAAVVVDLQNQIETLEKAGQIVISDKPGSDDGIYIDLQIPGNSISGEWLQQFAEDDITLNVTTNEGSSWQIKMQDVKKDSIDPERSYDLTYKITEQDRKNGVASDTVYMISFSDNVDFNSLVGAKLGSDTANHFASLYQEAESSSKDAESIQNVVVDNDGKAWFGVANTNKSTDYYIGIDVEGVDVKNSIIPASLYPEYGEMMDAYGNIYSITRTSKWGITGGQFALYMGLALGFIIIVVTVVMVSVNRARLLKQKEAYGKQKK